MVPLFLPSPKLLFIMKMSQNTDNYNQLSLPLLLAGKRTLSLVSFLHLEKVDPDCPFPASESNLGTFCLVEVTAN